MKPIIPINFGASVCWRLVFSFFNLLFGDVSYSLEKICSV